MVFERMQKELGESVRLVRQSELKQPTPTEIKEVRQQTGLTQQQAAELVHRADGARWREWEGGKYGIDLAVWELFLLKTGLRALEKT